jgi:hypothetical protein
MKVGQHRQTAVIKSRDRLGIQQAAGVMIGHGIPVETGTSTGNRPGANCDPMELDNTATSQTITYDNTPPALAAARGRLCASRGGSQS